MHMYLFSVSYGFNFYRLDIFLVLEPKPIIITLFETDEEALSWIEFFLKDKPKAFEEIDVAALTSHPNNPAASRTPQQFIHQPKEYSTAEIDVAMLKEYKEKPLDPDYNNLPGLPGFGFKSQDSCTRLMLLLTQYTYSIKKVN